MSAETEPGYLAPRESRPTHGVCPGCQRPMRLRSHPNDRMDYLVIPRHKGDGTGSDGRCSGVYSRPAMHTDTLTADEQRERDDLLKRGYRDITDAPRGIRVGARVRHGGERYRDAYLNGTGVVVAVMEKSPSSWVTAGWGKRDIELIVRTDKDRHGTGRFIGCWADYHTVVIEP